MKNKHSMRRKRKKVSIWAIMPMVMVVLMVGMSGCRKTITGPTPPDNGNEIDYPFNVSNDEWNSYDPYIGIDSKGKIYIIWQDAIGLKIRIRDENKRWSDVDTIAKGVLGYGLAVDIYDNVHIVWLKTGSDSAGFAANRVFYRELYSDGVWGDIVELTDTPDADQPVIAADSMGGVHVMWHSNNHGWLYKYKRAGGGWEWKDTLVVSTDNPSLYSKPDGSLIMIFSPWYHVLYYEHPSGGRWSPEFIVDTSTQYTNSWFGYYGYDRDRDRGYVFWTEQTYACGSNTGEIFYRYKENGVWSDAYKVEGTCGWPRTKRIFIEGGDIEVIFDDGRFQDIYYLFHGKDSTWKVDTLIRYWGSCAINCVIDNAKTLHCAWSVRDNEGQFDIYYGEREFGEIIRE